MYNKQKLIELPLERLKEIAKGFGIPVDEDTTVEDLVATILKGQIESIGSRIIESEQHPEENEEFQSSGPITRPDDHHTRSRVIGDSDTEQSDKDASVPNFSDAASLSKRIQQDGSMIIGESVLIEHPSSTAVEGHTSDFLLNLKPGYKLQLKSKVYEILSVLSPLGETLEAVIYKVKDEDGELRVVKLYSNHEDPWREPNGEALERIKAIEDEDVLRLYDFGIGQDKLFGKHCFEISDYARGGNLLEVKNFKEKYSYDFIRNHVIKEIFQGIKRLHRAGIIHCDLKPRNIFYLDEEQTDLIIGDYGSAKTRGAVEQKNIEVASRVIGTDHYLAPEQLERIISEKNDYYAFGMILIHLLYPEQFAEDEDYSKVDRKKFDSLKRRKYTRQKILTFNPKFEEVNKLIEKLTIQGDLQNRWGEKEVETWLKETDSKFDTSSLKEMGLFLARNKSAYLNSQKKEKRIAFLKKINRHDLIHHDYEEFLFKVFSQETVVKLEVLDLKIQPSRSCDAAYQLQQSLTDYFKAQDIEYDLKRELHNPQNYSRTKAFFQGAGALFKNFFSYVNREHRQGDRALINEQDIKILKNSFQKRVRKQLLSLNLSESYTAFLLWLPVLGIMALFVYTNAAGISLFRQMTSLLSLDLYAQNPETYNYWWGFYAIFAFFSIFLLFSALPSFWLQSKWEVISKKNNFLLLMGIMILLPAIFGLSNWLYEGAGILLLVLIFVGMVAKIESIKSKHHQDILKFISGILMLLAVTRIGIGLIVYFQGGNPMTYSNGLVEIIMYVAIFFMLLILPVYRQIFRLYHYFHLALKSAIILGLLTLLVLLGIG